jgi:hypothetical protein
MNIVVEDAMVQDTVCTVQYGTCQKPNNFGTYEIVVGA